MPISAANNRKKAGERVRKRKKERAVQGIDIPIQVPMLLLPLPPPPLFYVCIVSISIIDFLSLSADLFAL